MFILDITIENVARLAKAFLYDFVSDKKGDKTKNKNDKDGYVANDGTSSNLKSDRDLYLLFLGFIFNSEKQRKQFNDYISILEKNLKGSDSDNNEKAAQYLSGTLSEYKNLFKNEDHSKKNNSRQYAQAALASIDASHPMTALSKLIQIAKNSDFPSDIRAFAMALVNDALSHMKNQDVDNKSAQTLVKLLNNTPPQVREILFSALKDAKKIEEESKKKKHWDVDKRVNRNLTLA
ncbi:MAG: hypothetical protein HYR97_00620 [Candidatus Melainabacteria bacterium]|nr:hypothetical protein [Candidatus Melainabacteria bacterium]